MVSSLHRPYFILTSQILPTKVEFCINEWKTGTFVRQNLHEPTLKEKFTMHLKDLIKWDGIAPEVTKNIRQKIFDDLRFVRANPRAHLPPLLTSIFFTVRLRPQRT